MMEIVAGQRESAAEATRQGWSWRLSLLWIAAHAVLLALLPATPIVLLYICGPFGAIAGGLAFGGAQFAFLRRAAARKSTLPIWWLAVTTLAAVAILYVAYYGQVAFDARCFPYPTSPGLGASRAAYGAYVTAVFHRTALLACLHGLMYGVVFGVLQIAAPLFSTPRTRRLLTWFWWIPVSALAGLLLGAIAVDWPETLGISAPSAYGLTHSAGYAVLSLLLPGMVYGVLTGIILTSIFRRRAIAQPSEANP